ncbi:MAG TPA: phosphatase PAP2 family protein [Spirochaetota bacterium]|nr:phosphatase PAP2 family protein [Spirochaetota bacterium]HOS33082.1 phosphatase PAP2 family protein [Spirochaetota bacterium]HOS56337.1 phosphatase PAP2 family protein [Spirochaetota bacterium]HPK62312.1 phosphatase PAP2 family protein [Spirochaetota bacterium]HQF78777.1 phosphatase PAP2 family protein [Spirochaetota bacterium]
MKILKIKKQLKYWDIIFIRKLRNVPENLAVKLISHIGSFIFIIAVMAIIFFVDGFVFNKIFVVSALSLTINTVVVFILKYTVKRDRRVYIRNIKYRYDPYSFPSGHVSRLTGFIFPFAQAPYVSILFTILAFVSAFGRMSRKYHYFSDCLAGFIIGLISGLIASALYFVNSGLFERFINAQL